MPSELALQAYVFLGNALYLMVNNAGAAQFAEFHTTERRLQDLYRKIEPLKPTNILGNIGVLAVEERNLLVRVAVWCVERLGTDFESVGGVTRDEARSVIAWLEQDVGGG